MAAEENLVLDGACLIGWCALQQIEVRRVKDYQLRFKDRLLPAKG